MSGHDRLTALMTAMKEIDKQSKELGKQRDEALKHYRPPALNLYDRRLEIPGYLRVQNEAE